MQNCGMECKIIRYATYHDIDVQFTDGTIVTNRSCKNFKAGNIKNPNIESRHLNETRTMNCGLKATIIEYFNNENISIQFEDGLIVKNRSYGNFQKRSIGHPKHKVGVSINELICLYYFKELGFGKSEKGSLKNLGLENNELDLYNQDFYGHRIAIEYDGYTRKDGGHTIEKDLIKNERCHKSNIMLYRIREPNLPELNSTSKDYQLFSDRVKSESLEIIIRQIISDLAALTNQRIDVIVDLNKDEEQIYKFIKENYGFGYKDRHIGEKRLMNCGFEAEVVDYIDNKHLSIRFLNDGTIVDNVRYEHFKEGCVMHPKRLQYSDRLNETRTMSCGLMATVIEYFGCRNCTVQFSDGVVVKNVNYNHFKKCIVGHPNINPGSHTLRKNKRLNQAS
jgi:hypothetical protein